MKGAVGALVLWLMENGMRQVGFFWLAEGGFSSPESLRDCQF